MTKELRAALEDIATMLPGSVPLPMTEEEYLRSMLHEVVRKARAALASAESGDEGLLTASCEHPDWHIPALQTLGPGDGSGPFEARRVQPVCTGCGAQVQVGAVER